MAYEPSSPFPTTLKWGFGSLRVLLPYAIAFVLTVGLTMLWLRPWSVDWQGVFPDANDLVWNQAETLAHGQAGPFGSTEHLSWPFGYQPWSHPVLGGLWALMSWILTGPFSIPSALALYLCWSTSVGVTAASLLFLFRTWLGNRIPVIAVTAASVTAASSFALTRVIQPNVAAFFLVPIAIAAIARWPSLDPRRRLLLVAGVTLAALAASMWWVIVGLLIAAIIVVIELIRREFSLAKSALSVTLALGIGFIAQSMLYQHALRPGAAQTRGPWDSNLYGGHLVDLIMASPSLNAVFPHLLAVVPGASIGTSFVGFTSMLAAIGLVAIVLCGAPRAVGHSLDTRVLADASIITVLLFLAGGLGNLQSGIAVLLGTESPARVFSRLIIVVAALGVAWVLIGAARFVESRPRRWARSKSVWVASFACMFMLMAWAADARQTPPGYPAAFSSLPEYPATQFLTNARPPCPVAQLPQEGMPVVRTPTPNPESGRYFYRGLVPYLMFPEYFWSIGSWEPDGDTSLNGLSTSLSIPDLVSLKQQGFCAVLYDVRLAGKARESKIPLEGRDRDAQLRADFESQEYAVYLL